MRSENNKVYDSGSIGWWILGFIFPLVGLILFLAWIDIKPKSSRKAGWGALASVITGIVLGVLFFFGSLWFADKQIDKLSSYQQSDKVALTQDSEGKKKKATNNGDFKEIDTTKLSTPQIKAWVTAIMDKKYPPEIRTITFHIDVKRGDDSLAYGTVVPDAEVDTMDQFRINAKGELEEAGYYQGKPGTWIVVSKKYLDTSMVDAYKEPTQNGMVEYENEQMNESNQLEKNGITIKDYSQMAYSDAVQSLVQLGFSKSHIKRVNVPSETSPTDEVVSQEPVSGTSVTSNDIVTLKVSSGSTYIMLRDLTDEDKNTAESTISNLGLKYSEQTEFSDDVEEGKVIRTEPGAGTSSIKQGDTVTVYISKGSES